MVVIGASFIGFNPGGIVRPISVLMMLPAISSMKKIIRLAKPIINPSPTSTVIMPANPQKSAACTASAGNVAATMPASRAPSARRSWTGKLRAEKMGNTASIELARKKTISQLVRWIMGGGHCAICGIFPIMPAANSTSVRSIQGISRISSATMARALGTKVRVCS